MKQSRIRKRMNEAWKNTLEKTNPNNIELVKALRVMAGLSN
jgi:hypothetical protein